MTARQRAASRRPCPTHSPPRIYIPQEVHAMRRIGFYLFIMAVFLLAPLLALPQKAVPAPANSRNNVHRHVLAARESLNLEKNSFIELHLRLSF